jgi:hypothetical protein
MRRKWKSSQKETKEVTYGSDGRSQLRARLKMSAQEEANEVGSG